MVGRSFHGPSLFAQRPCAPAPLLSGGKHDQDTLTERENIWRAHGMPEETQAFATVLYRNNVAPEMMMPFICSCRNKK